MKKNINKISKIGILVFGILCVLCPVMYSVIGSKVLEDGTLDEPFYLTIFGYCFLLLFIVCLIICLITKKYKKN